MQFDSSWFLPVEIDTGVTSLDDISVDDLYDQAEASVNGEGRTTNESRSRTTYPRSEVVRKYALRVADGVCQGCGNDAPFLTDNREPFLKVHHLRRHSDGGADHPKNVIALCRTAIDGSTMDVTETNSIKN